MSSQPKRNWVQVSEGLFIRQNGRLWKSIHEHYVLNSNKRLLSKSQNMNLFYSNSGFSVKDNLASGKFS